MRQLIAIAVVASVAACGQQPPEEAPADDADPVEISLNDTAAITMLNDGRLLLDDEEMTAAELGKRLLGMDPRPHVTIGARSEVKYRAVEDLLRDLRAVLAPGQFVRVTFGPFKTR